MDLLLSVTACNKAQVNGMKTIRVIRRDIKKAYKQLDNWRAVGAQFGIDGAMAWRIVEEDYEPKDPVIRLVLGLPAMGKAPVCPHCGQVHTTKRCTARRPKRRIRDLFDVPVDELRRWIVERKEY